MPKNVQVPAMLLKKIKKNRPDVYAILAELESMRIESNGDAVKRIRKKLRDKCFYLSRLSEGEDPFVHNSLWADENTEENFSAEDCLMTEDDVVMYLSTYLEKQGWENVSKCLGHKQGIDILAIKGTQTLIVADLYDNLRTMSLLE